MEQAEASFKRNGAQVHYAVDDEAVNAAVLRIMNETGSQTMVKSKSMLTEEVHMLDYLEKNGKTVVETDLGEFILQLDGDHPSHIVTPIVHKNRRGIAKTFEREGLGDYNDDPEVITRRARKFLRQKYIDAEVGLTGANFVSAESGRMVLVTNEGNSRFCMAANKIHIAVIGIEKLVPTDRDLGLFVNLIGRSGTSGWTYTASAALSMPNCSRHNGFGHTITNGRIQRLVASRQESYWRRRNPLLLISIINGGITMGISHV